MCSFKDSQCFLVLFWFFFLTTVLLHLHFILPMNKMLRILLCPFQSEHKLHFFWKLDPCMYLEEICVVWLTVGIYKSLQYYSNFKFIHFVWFQLWLEKKNITSKKIPPSNQPSKKEKYVTLGCFVQYCFHGRSGSEFLAEALWIRPFLMK